MVTELVHQYGTKAWSDICKHLPGRTNKQCRDRWVVFTPSDCINILLFYQIII